MKDFTIIDSFLNILNDKPSYNDDFNDTVNDVDDEYITHTAVDISEQEEGEEEPETEEKNLDDVGGEEAAAMDDPMMTDPMTAPDDQGPTTADELGRIYELKQIYNRLLTVDTYLDSITANVLVKVREYTSSALDMFRTMINNIQLFKDDLDDIIVVYYEFIKAVYEIIKKYYKLQAMEQEKNK